MSTLSSTVSSILSPTSSTSSYDLADSTRSRSSTVSTQSYSLAGDSDDEIVWTVSSEYQLSSDVFTESEDDDFIVLNRPQSASGVSTPLPTSHNLTSALSNLSLGSASECSASSTDACSSKRGSKRRNRTSKLAVPSDPPSQQTSEKRRKRKGKKQTGLGARPIVDDASEGVSECATSELSVYDEAVNYITSFLSNPSAHDDSRCRLTFLQSLIIELGIESTSLPASLTAAKAMLKSHAFLNVREYLSVRDQGLEAIQKAMYPSRSALIKSIRNKSKGRASREWVKDHGLSVLLVSCFHN
ncbi:hypothetical protein VKT23_004015 [Stygiomarasmius scandens]|uniref:Uncharacterized protein n=1 Tax=Marasmiellus scandens TaxID=2682957 RepID=A0ABR1JSZ6_9AGAR